MSSLVTPFWFKQRQGKAEPAGSDTYRVSGPNMQEAYLSVRPQEGGGWEASVRLLADGPVAARADGIATAYEAWEAAFELFREHGIYKLQVNQE
jgi:hypothetical protein